MKKKLQIGNFQVESYYDYLDLTKIMLDPKNPRLGRYLDMDVDPKLFRQDLLIEIISTERGGSFKSLLNGIQKNGTRDPIIVVEPNSYLNNKKYIVIEGNRRYTAYHELSKKENGEKFNKIPCQIIKKNDATKDLIKFIQSVDHLAGKKDWEKYARAKYFYDLYYEDSHPYEYISSISKLSVNQIEKIIHAYETFREADLKYEFEGTKRNQYFSQIELLDTPHWRSVFEDNIISKEDMVKQIFLGNTKSSYDLRRTEYMIRIVKNDKAREIWLKNEDKEGYNRARDYLNKHIDGDTEFIKRLESINNYYNNNIKGDSLESLGKSKKAKDIIENTISNLQKLFNYINN